MNSTYYPKKNKKHIEIDGMPFDYGPHIFHSNDEEITKFIKKHCSDLLVEKEFLVKIEEAIAGLPDKQKEVFLLSRMEKKKYKEIILLRTGEISY